MSCLALSKKRARSLTQSLRRMGMELTYPQNESALPSLLSLRPQIQKIGLLHLHLKLFSMTKMSPYNIQNSILL